MTNKNKATAMDSVVELNPKIKKSRSTFNLGIKEYTSFNVGELVPIGGITEVLPGDTFNIDLSMLVRMTSTSKRPPMDNLHMDVFCFFIPNRFLDAGWEEVQGASHLAWTQPSTTCSVVRIPDSTAIAAGSLLNHLGIPCYTTSGQTDFNIYPVYAYWKIVNDWFRDENIQDEIAWSNVNGTYLLNNLPQINSKKINEAGSLFNVAKFHDVFTSALPSPQKGNAVTVPIGTKAPLMQLPASGLYSTSRTGQVNPGIMFATSSNPSGTSYPLGSVDGAIGPFSGFAADGDQVVADSTGSEYLEGLYYTNLVADLSNATGATVNALRIAFQTQKAYELDARGGSARYCELLENRFGAKNPDLRLGRSELLGHYRFDLGMSEIATTSGPAGSSATASNLLGSAAYLQGVGSGSSKTGNRQHICVKSFTEHGLCMIVACVRPDLTYQQGIEPFWSKKSRFDFYEPIFAHVGEMPVRKSALWAGSYNSTDVFGYQEAWYDYRYKMTNQVSGLLASDANQGFDIFHYAQDFSGAPSLANFIPQDKISVDRTLAVASTVADQFILNAQGVIKATRVMPLFSIPGLIDHF